MANYRGDTFGKAVARALQELDTLKHLPSTFHKHVHAFLASKFAGNISVLRSMGVQNHLLWAIDNNPFTIEYLVSLFPKFPGIRIFNEDIDSIIQRYHTQFSFIPNLDYEGNMLSNESTTREVLKCLHRGTMIKFTHIQRGDHFFSESQRVRYLTEMVNDAIGYKCSLTQTILYQSRDSSTDGSPMFTASFFLGKTYGNVDELDLRYLGEVKSIELLIKRIVDAGFKHNQLNAFLNRSYNENQKGT